MNIATSIRYIKILEIDITIYIDANIKGWGITDGSNPSCGRWEDNEIQHIYVLELKAALFGIVAYCKNKSLKHARVMVDSTIAVAYVNNTGGTKSSQCNKLATENWLWAIHRNLDISEARIAGDCNISADEKSRKLSKATEWQLNPSHFKKMCTFFGTPDIHLFASRLNRQVSQYVSWHQEPEANAIDAFSLNGHITYVISVLNVLQKNSKTDRKR